MLETLEAEEDYIMFQILASICGDFRHIRSIMCPLLIMVAAAKLHPTGYDIRLFNHPSTERSIMHIAEEINVPTPTRRIALYYHLQDYYASRGDDKSIKIVADGNTVSSRMIVVCNIEDSVALSLLLAKLLSTPSAVDYLFPQMKFPEMLSVSYYSGFSSDLGGGFYSKPRPRIDIPEGAITYKISKKITGLDPLIFISQSQMH